MKLENIDENLQIDVDNVFTQKINQLNKICNEYPKNIPLNVLSEFLGYSATWLIYALENGKCPYGFASQGKGERRTACLPTLTFYMWYTNGNYRLFESNKKGKNNENNQ